MNKPILCYVSGSTYDINH